VTRSRTRIHALAAGYTVVELLMSLSVLGIGTAGVIAMQKVTIDSNRHAKNLAIATRIAEAWADELVADSALWTMSKNGVSSTPQSTLANTDWLKNASAGAISWIRPAYVPTRLFGPAFNALGAPVNPDTQGALAQFCTDLRLAWIKEDNAALPGNGVVRAQIRVFWRRDDNPTVAVATNGDLCAASNAPVDVDANLAAYDVIYLTTAIRQLPKWSSE
jgi:type II secretory pathway pseudopilin PulG